MFLRFNTRKKDGKMHRYWSVVENKRLHDGRVAQRQVLYLGEVNASQRAAWRKTLEAHSADSGTTYRAFGTERVSLMGGVPIPARRSCSGLHPIANDAKRPIPKSVIFAFPSAISRSANGR